MRGWLLLFLLLVSVIPGCGSDSTADVSSPPVSISPQPSLGLPSPGGSATPLPSVSPGASPSASPLNPPVATLTVQLVLEQLKVVQAYVQTVRLSGLDAGGRRVFGPVERPKQATLVFTGVPSNVVEIQLDLLIGSAGDETVTGVYRGPINLTSGAATLTDPDFVDVNTVRSLSVSGPATLARGARVQLVAQGTFTNGRVYDLTTAVRWASSATGVATVSATGEVTALTPGNATITASRDALSAGQNVTVSPASLVGLAVSPANASIATFSTQAFTAQGTFSDNTTLDLTTQVTWASSNTSVATISTGGLASANGPGRTVITARQGGVTGNATLTVSGPSVVNATIVPQNPRVPLFSYQTFGLNATLSDGSVQNLTSQATWTSSAPSIAAVTQPGEIRALNEGMAVLTAAVGGVQAQTNVTAFQQSGGGGGGGNSAVRFAPAVNFTTGTRSPQQIVAGNLTASGRPDVATADLADNDVGVLLNTGGAFGAASFFGTGNGPFGLAMGSLDSTTDAFLDVVTADESGNTVSVLLNPAGDGSLSILNSFATGPAPHGVAVGSFNSTTDAFLDVATANSAAAGGVGGVSVLFNNGTGMLTGLLSFDTGLGPFGIATGDFNSDTFADLAVACGVSDAVTVRFGNGTGVFPTFANVTVGTAPARILVRDLNGDGFLDFATANRNDGTVSLVYGNGAGGFAAALSVPAGSVPGEVAAGDFNRDGLLDLAVCNAGSDNVSILTGNGSGLYTPAATLALATGASARTIVAADFNGDGRMDLATGNQGTNSVSLFLQQP